MTHPKEERTVVLIKPDGVVRGLTGEIIRRFEQRGLKIIALKLVHPTREQAAGHYSGSNEWLSGMGQKTLDSMREAGIDVKQVMGTEDPLAIGKIIQGWNTDYLSSGPVVAMIVQGVRAIANVRKIVGSTLPAMAVPGTIRGDFSIDHSSAANTDRRSLRNLVHASGDPDEAAHEIAHWFTPEEIVAYERCDERAMF